MRWKLIDRITAYRRGATIAGLVAVPFEGAILLEPLGRDGVWPESLVLAAGCELALWAAAEASGWEAGAELAGVDGLRIDRAPVHAELLTLRLDADGAFSVTGDAGASAGGRLSFTPVALASLLDPRVLAEDWEVLRGPAA